MSPTLFYPQALLLTILRCIQYPPYLTPCVKLALTTI